MWVVSDWLGLGNALDNLKTNNKLLFFFAMDKSSMRGVIGPEDGGWGGHDPERAGSHQLDQHAVTGLIFYLFSRNSTSCDAPGRVENVHVVD